MQLPSQKKSPVEHKQNEMKREPKHNYYKRKRNIKEEITKGKEGHAKAMRQTENS